MYETKMSETPMFKTQKIFQTGFGCYGFGYLYFVHIGFRTFCHGAAILSIPIIARRKDKAISAGISNRIFLFPLNFQPSEISNFAHRVVKNVSPGANPTTPEFTTTTPASW
jgi:hypothetical protein